MSRNKSAVEKLIIKAKNIEPKSGELTSAIDALVALGAGATHSNSEYKTVQDLVAKAKEGGAGEGDEGQNQEDAGAGANDGLNEQEDDAGAGDEEIKEDESGDAGDDDAGDADNIAGAGDSESEDDAGDESDAGKDENAGKAREPRKVSQEGTKMIGSMWYNKKDGYKKGFKTAGECSEHFNG